MIDGTCSAARIATSGVVSSQVALDDFSQSNQLEAFSREVGILKQRMAGVEKVTSDSEDYC